MRRSNKMRCNELIGRRHLVLAVVSIMTAIHHSPVNAQVNKPFSDWTQEEGRRAAEDLQRWIDENMRTQRRQETERQEHIFEQQRQVQQQVQQQMTRQNEDMERQMRQSQDMLRQMESTHQLLQETQQRQMREQTDRQFREAEEMQRQVRLTRETLDRLRDQQGVLERQWKETEEQAGDATELKGAQQQMQELRKVLDNLDQGQEALEQEANLEALKQAPSVDASPPSSIATAMLAFVTDRMNTTGRTHASDPTSAGKTDTAIVIGRSRFPIYLDPSKTNCTTALLEAFQAATGANLAGEDLTTAKWSNFVKTWQMMDVAQVRQQGNEYRQGAVKALVDSGLGERIDSLRDVKQGDLIQAFPKTTGTDGDLMIVAKVSDQGGGFVIISAGFSGSNAYRTAGYSFDSFNSKFKEYYIGRFRCDLQGCN
jgi:hypothetical protein